MINQQTSPWEHRLLDLALEALETHLPFEPVHAEPDLLSRAYAYCAEVTARHSRTFYMASGFLPAEKRQAARALYAFCRVSDDLIDQNTGDLCAELNEWRHRAFASHPPSDDLVSLAWTDARTRFNIPRRYAEQLIDGVGRDVDQQRYESFEELSDYCYGVASTVGLMAMHIIGFSGPEAVPYAVKLGVALQLTNILRDIGEDLRSGRIYLPQDELAAYGITEQDLYNNRLDSRWQAFLNFQIQRNRRLYAESMPGIQLLNPDGRFAIAAAAELYQAILTEIEVNRGDVFTRRAHLSTFGKLRRLPGIWLRSR
jgi:phytoene synthase